MAMLTESGAYLHKPFREPDRAQEDLNHLISRHQTREGTVHAASQFLRLTLDALPTHIAVLDAEGTIILTNKAWRTFAHTNGGTLDQVDVGANYLKVCDNACITTEASQVANGIRAVQTRQEGMFYLEYPCPTPSRDRWFSLCVTRLHEEDPVQVVVTHEDITERKEAQEALVTYTEALERSNADLEQFAYAASHDLQEPLRTINSFVMLLQARHGAQFDDDAGRLFDFIVDGSSRMQVLITDLLAYARLGCQVPRHKLVKAAEVLEDTLDGLQTLLDTTGAEVTYGALPAIEADPTHFGLLLQNLISNGIKFRSVAPPRVHIAAMPTPEGWRFSVRDNGIGIEPAFQENIFEVFRQLHSRGQYEGTGMGLAICKKIVDHHGGRIWVDSAPNKGATFYFTIPG